MELSAMLPKKKGQRSFARVTYSVTRASASNPRTKGGTPPYVAWVNGVTTRLRITSAGGRLFDDCTAVSTS